MINSVTRITLNLQETNTMVSVKAKRGDTSRKLLIHLSDGSIPYHISDECYATFTAKKPDGTKINNACTIENNVIHYEFTPQTCSAVGTMKAEIKLYGADDKMITSACFLISVYDTVYTEGDEVSSESEMNTLDDLILRANAFLNETGKLLRWQGEWDSEAEYEANDLVLHQEILYVAEDAAAAGTEPGSEGAAWVPIAGMGTGSGAGASDEQLYSAVSAYVKKNPLVEIKSVTQTQTSALSSGLNIFTIELSTGEKLDFHVHNGQMGPTGPRGLPGPSVMGPQGPAGNDGADGGHYVPSVSQPDANTLQFDFIPSQDDMPAVDPVQVELPVGQGSGENADYVGVEPAEDDIPKIFFGGALQQTKDEAVVPFRYISKTDDFSGYAEIKAQGNSSMGYPKKNQTVKMFTDGACETKMKVNFKGWGKQNKHCYKANWIDLTHARNVVSARLWADIVKSRADYDSLPELLRTSPNQGAVDGFPVKVYADGVYQGRYTVNIPKDKWMANMDDELDTHCILCGEGYVSGCFREVSTSQWSDEIHDTMPSTIADRWKEVISFVMNSTDAEFKSNLGNYFDIPSLIDYHLFGLISCGLDAYGKNQLYMTYDGQKWIASMYDMDSTWGLWWSGTSFVATDYDRSEYQDFKDGEGNLLYIRLEENFHEELQTRWAELKNGALSIENIINRFERFTDIAPAELVKEDYAITTANGAFISIPSQPTNNIQQIRAFALARYAWTEDYVAGLAPEVEVPCTGISLSESTLTFTDEGSQTLTATVTPDGCTDSVRWVSNKPEIVTVSDGVVTAIANGSATVTAYCGEYSASCAVSVSGIAEPVHCTGIILDKTELTFTSEGTQTITATVTPADTTETVVWVSSAPAVASITVEGNVCTVQGVSNGNAVITVSCGEYSASCTVTVSGIVVLYRLANETVFDGSQKIDTGIMLFDTDKAFTMFGDYQFDSDSVGLRAFGCKVNAPPYPGFEIRIGNNSYERCKVAVVKEVGNTTLKVYSLEGTTYAESTIDATDTLFEKTALVGDATDASAYKFKGTFYRCEIHGKTLEESETNALLGLETSAIDITGSTWTSGKKVDGTGAVVNGGNYVSDLIEIPDSTRFLVFTNSEGGAFTWMGIWQYDENQNFISGKEYTTVDATVPAKAVAATGVKYVRLSANAGSTASPDPANQTILTVKFEK